jgi:hypothetical protein
VLNFFVVRSREVKPRSANSLLAEGATVSVLLKRRRIFGDVSHHGQPAFLNRGIGEFSEGARTPAQKSARSHRAAGALEKSVDSWRPPEFLAALTWQ